LTGPCAQSILHYDAASDCAGRPPRLFDLFSPVAPSHRTGALNILQSAGRKQRAYDEQPACLPGRNAMRRAYNNLKAIQRVSLNLRSGQTQTTSAPLGDRFRRHPNVCVQAVLPPFYVSQLPGYLRCCPETEAHCYGMDERTRLIGAARRPHVKCLFSPHYFYATDPGLEDKRTARV
jgi:hypothetical protein